MKQKAFVCLLFVLALVVGLSPGAAAMSIDLSDVTVSADVQGLHVRAEGQDPASHFARRESLMPGDTVRRAMVITNSLPDACTVYLRTQDLRSNPADFVNKIEMKLSLDGTVVYDGELSSGLDAQGNPLENSIEIGRIEPGVEYRLQAEFHFPGRELDNRYQKAEAATQWVLDASLVPPDSSSSSSSSSGSSEAPSSSDPYTPPGSSSPPGSSRPPVSSGEGGSYTPGRSAPPITSQPGATVRPAPDPSAPEEAETDILEGRVSLSNFLRTDCWSLLSLLMSCAGIIVSLVVLVSYLLRKDKNKDEDGKERVPYDEPPEDEIEEEVEKERSRRQRLTVLRCLIVLAALLAVVLFLALDNLRLPMVFINRWTIYVALAYIVHLVALVLYILFARKREVEDPTEEESDPADTDSELPRTKHL